MWKQIRYKGIDLQYIINEHGDIVSLEHVSFLKYRHFETDKDGYLKVTLRIRGKSKKFFIHRLVAMMFVPGYDEEKVVNHKDGDKQNNHYSNLEWVYSWENEKHASENYLKANGTGNSLCRHDDKVVHDICKLLIKGWSVIRIATKLKFRMSTFIR